MIDIEEHDLNDGLNVEDCCRWTLVITSLCLCVFVCKLANLERGRQLRHEAARYRQRMSLIGYLALTSIVSILEEPLTSWYVVRRVDRVSFSFAAGRVLLRLRKS